MRSIAIAAVPTAAVLLLPAGCKSPQLSTCEQANPEGSPGYRACWAAELQRQSEELDRQDALSRRGRN